MNTARVGDRPRRPTSFNAETTILYYTILYYTMTGIEYLRRSLGVKFQ
jgi:hypothetical protein